jgi:transitional endoplasmic reticulum ATPase
MDDEMISGLLEALAFSPDNVPLRLHLAETLYNHGKYADAKEHCYIALRHQPNNTKAKEALAKASFRLNAFSECIIVLEELERIESLSFSAQLLLTQAYVKEKSISKAIESYQAVLKIDPRYRDKELDAMLRTPSNNARDPFNQNDGEDFYEDEDDEL